MDDDETEGAEDVSRETSALDTAATDALIAAEVVAESADRIEEAAQVTEDSRWTRLETTLTGIAGRLEQLEARLTAPAPEPETEIAAVEVQEAAPPPARKAPPRRDGSRYLRLR